MKSKNISFLFFLTLTFLVFGYRILLLVKSNTFSTSSPYNAQYLEGIQNNFWEFVKYYHVKPLGALFRDKFLVEIIGAESLASSVMVFTTFLSGISALFIMISLINLRINLFLSFFISLLYGFSIPSFDFWRNGSHYDHLNPFGLSLMALGVVLTFRSYKFIYVLVLAIFFNLLTYSPAPIFIPLVFLPLFVHAFLKKQNKRPIFSGFILSCVFLLLVAGKNYIRYDFFTTSSLAGTTRLQFTYISIGDQEKFLKFVSSGNYPDWWMDCFNKSLQFDKFLGPIYGICYSGSGQFERNFNELKEVQKPHGNQKILTALNEDIENLKNRPWLLSGPVPEVSSKFSIEYGKISGEVWKKFLLSEPLQFFKTFKLAFNKYFGGQGADFLIGLNYEPQHFPYKETLSSRILAPVFLFSFYSSILLFIMTPIFILKRIWNKMNIEEVGVLLTLNSLFIITAVILNIMICCENARMFITLSPLCLIIGTYLLDRGGKFVVSKTVILNK